MKPGVHVIHDGDEWDWRIVSRKGVVLAEAHKYFDSRRAAVNNLRVVLAALLKAWEIDT